MSYLDTYKAWLASPALSAEEKAELESIKNDLSAAGELGIYQAYSILKKLLDAESKSRKN